MSDRELKSFFDELKESMEKVHLAVKEGLDQAEKEVSRFFEEMERDADEFEVVDEEVEEPEAVDDADEELEEEPLDPSCIGDHIDEIVEEARSILENAREEVGDKWEVLEEKIREVVTTSLDSLGVSPDAEVIKGLEKRIAELEKKLADVMGGPSGGSDAEIRSVGGGWYEIVVDGEVVDKVQGKENAKKAAGRRG